MLKINDEQVEVSVMNNPQKLLAGVMILSLGLSLDSHSPPIAVAGDKATVVNRTIPQTLLDAMLKVEQDKQDSEAASNAVRVAQEALDAGMKRKDTADAAMKTDQEAFLKLWAELYGPVVPPPPPTPPTPPTPPVPPTPPTPNPVLVPTKLRVVVFYHTGEAWASTPEIQRQIVTSEQPGSFRDWLSSNCLASADGTAEKRFWTTDTTVNDIAESASRWKPLVEAGGGKTGIVVQSGEGGQVTRFDMPSDSAAAITLLDRIANPKSLVIGESNYKQFLSVAGKSTGYIRGPPTQRGFSKFRSEYQIIPRSQWKTLVQQGKGTFLGDMLRAYKVPSKDQDGTNYCWAYASVSAYEAIRVLQGQPYVNLSPESVGGPIKNWRNNGGDGRDALVQLQKVGACRMDFMDETNSLRPSRWKTGWQADCGEHKVREAWADIDDGDFDAVFTAALLRLPVSIGLDWWGHQVLITGPVIFNDGSYGVEFRNSWGSDYGDDGYATLTERKSQPSGSFACISVGTSDRELNANTRGTVADLVMLRQESIRKIMALASSVSGSCTTENCPQYQNAQ
jgi:hypothetical protein